MVISEIRAVFNNDIEDVWKMVTSISEYDWRSDLCKTEVLNNNQFTEYSKGGYATNFTVTNTIPFKVWGFEMDNDNMHGYWTGVFVPYEGGTVVEFVEEVYVKKTIMKPFVKMYLKKQQNLYIADLKRALQSDEMERKAS